MVAEVEGRGMELSFDPDTKAHIMAASRWLTDSAAKPSLMLCGLYGNGKTTLAKAIASLISHVSIRERGYSRRMSMRMYTAKEICRLCADAEKFRDSHDEYRRLSTEPMLIIDDLGEEPKEVMVYGMPHTPVIDLLSQRYASQLTTVITTNLDVDEIKAKYGPRISDRLAEMVEPVVFENDSYRKNKGRKTSHSHSDKQPKQ